MPITDVLFDEKLEVIRRHSTLLARRVVAYWCGRKITGFSQDSVLANMRPDVRSLKAYIGTAFPKQDGFQSFDRDKCLAAWKKAENAGAKTVQMVYDAAWAGLAQ